MRAKVILIVLTGTLIVSGALIYLSITGNRRDVSLQAEPLFTGSQSEECEPIPEVAARQLKESIDRKDNKLYSSSIKSLIRGGLASLPCIERDLVGAPDPQKEAFAVVLASISGPRSTEILFLMASPRGLSKSAMTALSALQNRPINFPVTEHSMTNIFEIMKSSPSPTAGNAARVLAHVEDPKYRKQSGRAIVDRYFMEVLSKENYLPTHGSYLSPRALALNQFLVAMRKIGKHCIGEIQILGEKAQGVEEGVWFILAMGMSGNENFADQIKKIVMHGQDTSIRCIALHAYGACAGKRGLSFLESYSEDITESEFDRLPDGNPVYPLRNAALDEIMNLKRDESE